MKADFANRRHVVVLGSVLLLHAAVLWTLQSGLLRRGLEVVVPVRVISAPVELPQTLPEPPEPKLTTPARARSPQAPERVAPVRSSPPAPPSPVPVAVVDTAPSINAPTGSSVLQPVPAAVATPVAASGAPAVQGTGTDRLDLPSMDAEYLRNPKPDYPRISRQRGEQGKVVIHVLIGVDGSAQAAEIQTSSGFDRLDQAALATVKGWRYVPGKRAGVAQAMWFSVPINFVME